MYLSNLKLWNFRKFGSDEFKLDSPHLNVNFKKGLNVLIGENDSGKTAIIDAIKLVLKTHTIEYLTPDREDFCNDCNRFRIELRFDDLSDDEAKHFTEWLGWEKTAGDAKAYLRLIYDVKKNKERIFPTDVRAGVNEDGYPLEANAREHLKVTYLKPLRDASHELVPRKGSRLSKILHGHEAFRGKDDDHHLTVKLKGFSDEVKNYFSGEEALDDENGKKLKNKLDEFFLAFSDYENRTKFEPFGGDLRSILERLQLYVDGQRNLGLGSLNKLFMASEFLHLKKDDWDGLRLGLIEELEAHLHPQAQMKVVEYLQNQEDIQLILTTHSPNLASKVDIRKLIICVNNNAFPMGENTALNPKDYKFLQIFLDVTKSNLFFAKSIILVEGWAEEILIPSLARKLGREYDLTQNSISVVNVGSTAHLHYSKIFVRPTGFPINTRVSIVTDVDIREFNYSKPEGKTDPVPIEERYVRRNEQTLLTEINEKTNQLQVNFNDQGVFCFVAPRWTLEFCLLRSKSLSHVFKAVLKEVHSGTDWDRDFEAHLAHKLLTKTLKKSEIAYRLASLLDNDNVRPYQVHLDAEDDVDTIYYLLRAITYARGH